MPRQSPSRVKLTARAIKDLAERAVAFDVFDSEVRGFHVRVHPTGVITFALRYRDPAGGKPPRYHRLVLGQFGELTPDAARTLALAKRVEIKSGVNPVRAKRLSRTARTFDDAIPLFLGYLRQERSARYAAEAERVLRKHCAPLPVAGASRAAPVTGAVENWGPRPIASILREEILELHARMHATPSQANKLVQVLSSLWNFASTQGWAGVVTNPTHPAPAYKEHKRGRVLKDLEAAKLGHALREAEQHGAPWQAVGIIRIAFLTGMRREEAATLRWDAIDPEHARMVLAATKTGRSERPLGATTAALLESLRPMAREGSAFVFPSPDDANKPYRSTPMHWDRIRRAAGLADVRFHDLRHDTATEAGMRYPVAVLMALTGHVSASVASRYIHQHDDPTKRAADDVAERRAAKLDAVIDAQTGTLRGTA